MADAFLQQAITVPAGEEGGLAESMRYSLLAGGKRIRPVLALAFCDALGGDIEKALPAACALEMIHTYSLIHDDLPCMDDDVLRRGKPTNHVVYGECTATLAGDALQSLAFETLASAPLESGRIVRCLKILSEAAGYRGMCQGQFLDMEGEGKSLTAEELTHINNLKTGALLSGACRMGAPSRSETMCWMSFQLTQSSERVWARMCRNTRTLIWLFWGWKGATGRSAVSLHPPSLFWRRTLRTLHFYPTWQDLLQKGLTEF